MNQYKIFAFADEASANVDEQIKAMLKNNIDGLEIRNVDGVNVSEITTQKAVEVKKKLDDAGLSTWSIGSPIGKINIETGDFEEHIEKFKHVLEIANILDSKNIRMFSFFIPEGRDYKIYTNEIIDRLGKMIEIAENCSIYLCHENEKGIYGDIASRCLEIHKALPQLKGVFDPANFVQCKQDTKEAWEMLKDYIYYMHIKDALSDGSVVPSGAGEGNVEYLVDKFVKGGGSVFTIEPHLAVFDGLAALEQDGNTSEIGKKYVYKSNEEAFDAACYAFKGIIETI